MIGKESDQRLPGARGWEKSGKGVDYKGALRKLSGLIEIPYVQIKVMIM